MTTEALDLSQVSRQIERLVIDACRNPCGRTLIPASMPSFFTTRRIPSPLIACHRRKDRAHKTGVLLLLLALASKLSVHPWLVVGASIVGVAFFLFHHP